MVMTRIQAGIDGCADVPTALIRHACRARARGVPLGAETDGAGTADRVPHPRRASVRAGGR